MDSPLASSTGIDSDSESDEFCFQPVSCPSNAVGRIHRLVGCGDDESSSADSESESPKKRTRKCPQTAAGRRRGSHPGSDSNSELEPSKKKRKMDPQSGNGNAGCKAATAAGRRRRYKEDEHVKFRARSDNPDEWCWKARELLKGDFFKPDRPPGIHATNINASGPAASIFCNMMTPALRILLIETNKYGKLRWDRGMVKTPWVNVEPEELLVYLALVIAQSLMVKGNYRLVFQFLDL